VAALAVARRKGRAGAGVRRVRRILPVFQMAGIALRRKSQENTHRRLFVALFALNGGVRTEKREAILVILHLLDGNIPALYSVALLAIRAHLAAVNVSVAVRAILAHIREDRLGMAVDALHLFVHAPQRVAGLVVIEL